MGPMVNTPIGYLGSPKASKACEVSNRGDSLYNGFMRLLFGLGGLFLPLSAFAVLPGSSSDTNTTDYNFVGQIGGASGVLVGPNMVLTAKHVGAGTFTLPGFGSFSVVANSAVSDANSDLTLFRIDVGSTILPYATIDVSAMHAGDTVTMVGYGLSGSLNGSGTGYDVNVAGGVRRKANATYEFTDYIYDPGSNYLAGYSLIAPLRQNGQAALAGGDSGGGWFRNGYLVGTNAFIGTYGNGQDFVFSNSSTDFFCSGAISLSDNVLFLRNNGVAMVPEPASMAILGLGIVPLLRRRKRAA